MSFLKQISSLFVLIALSVCSAGAQDQQGSLIVNSTPPGAEVRLEGQVIVSGVTPATFRAPLQGEYKVIVKRPLYEKYTTRLLIDPTKHAQLDVTLDPKSRFKALWRSALLPGLGQRYAEQNTKAYIFHALALASLGAWGLTEADLNNKLDLYYESERLYNQAIADGRSDQFIAALRAQLEADRENAYNSETRRNISLGALAGTWTLSLLDIIFFFPREKGDVTMKSEVEVKGLTLSTSKDLEHVGLKVTYNF